MWTIEKAVNFSSRLGRALQYRPKEMFDEKDWAIMLLWDEMPRGIPRLARWRDEAGLGCVKLVLPRSCILVGRVPRSVEKTWFVPGEPQID